MYGNKLHILYAYTQKRLPCFQTLFIFSAHLNVTHKERGGALGWTGLCKEIVHIKTPRNKTSTNLGPLVLSRLPPAPEPILSTYTCMH